MAVASAAGFIALLDESNPKLKSHALTMLDQMVGYCWHEIADVIGKIESLYEDESFPDRKLAALVASKVYFHLGSYEDALKLALGAEDLFDVHASDIYVETVVAKCIDHYMKLRNYNAEVKEEKDKKPIDPRLESIVNRMFDRAFACRQYREAIGIAIDNRRMDILERAVKESDDPPRLLAYSVKSALAWIQNRKYRNEVLQRLVKLYSTLPRPDFINMCQCLIYLDDPRSVSEILGKLVTESDETTLMAYQIAFDSYESATQQFNGHILQSLRQRASVPSPNLDTINLQSYTGIAKGLEEDAGPAAPPSPASAIAPLSEKDRLIQKRIENLIRILSGDETISLHLQFLIKNNKTDVLILETIKDTVQKNVANTATVISNGFMHAGTTCDDFLSDDLEWISKPTKWSKFSAVASLGVIHKGRSDEIRKMVDTYLPTETTGSPGYMEGGGLYALGLAHANHGNDTVIEYLKTQLQSATSAIVQHGVCLGLGLAALGTQRQDVYDQLRTHLCQDDAVAGEAASLAMGLVMLGSNSADAIKVMISHAKDTKHEKILRGLAVGLACIMYGRMEEADALIETLSRDKDPLLRRSGVYTLAMAYCGTGNTEAIRRLLQLATSDMNDDVRRAAVTSLGFLLFRKPEECPPMVAMMVDSYNPQVRYGAALALGIACAGTGSKEGINLIEPLLNDPVSYVRQGAMIASALVMIQHNESTCPKVKDFRDTLMKTISDKHEEIMAKFGAILAHGILDAGGRNVTISMQSRNGHTDLASVIGMLVFLQHWYWFPLSHFLSLCFQPSCLITLTSDLKMPVMEFKSNAKPSQFAYPPPMEEKKEKQAERIETVVLSITNKAKKRQQDKAKQSKELEKMDVDTKDAKETKEDKDKKDNGEQSIASVSVNEKPKVEPEKMDVDTKETKDAKKDKKDKKDDGEQSSASVSLDEVPKAEPEPSFQMLKNPARVMKQQLKVMTVPEDSRYSPLKNIAVGGVILVRDKRTGQPVEFVQLEKTGGVLAEPEPPQPFEYFGV